MAVASPIGVPPGCFTAAGCGAVGPCCFATRIERNRKQNAIGSSSKSSDAGIDGIHPDGGPALNRTMRPALLGNSIQPLWEPVAPTFPAVHNDFETRSAEFGAAEHTGTTSVFTWISRSLMLISRTGENDPELANKISFQDPSLLRGSPCCAVLQHAGRILNDSAGSNDTYLKSGSVENIGTFISHNWSTPRRPKFQALTLIFHFERALFVTFLYTLVVLWLTASGRLPLLELYSYDLARKRFWGPYATAGGPVIFLVSMLCWQELFVFFPCWDQTVFLDKTCIHQTDENRKMKGVHGLAAFIRHSRRMVVVYTETYLKKLWTVYELASFFAIHPRGNLVVMPIFFPGLFVGLLISYTCYHLLVVLFHSTSVIDWAYSDHEGSRNHHKFVYVASVYVVAVPFCMLNAVWIRRWHLEQQRFVQHCQEFSVTNAKCFDENDRPVVQEGIHVFMRAVGRVHQDASEKEALQAFNRTVQRELPRVLRSSIGEIGFQYKYVWAVFLSAGLMAVDDLGAGIRAGLPAWHLYVDFLREVVKHGSTCPTMIAALSLAMAMTVTYGIERLRILFLINFLVSVISVTVPLSSVVLLDMLKPRAYSSTIWSFAYVLLCLLFLAMSLCVWAPRLRRGAAELCCGRRCASDKSAEPRRTFGSGSRSG